MPPQRSLAHEEIRREVLGYDDQELVQQAWTAFRQLDLVEHLKESICSDLEEAEGQLRRVISTEGRGRLRRFIIAHRFHSHPESG